MKIPSLMLRETPSDYYMSQLVYTKYPAVYSAAKKNNFLVFKTVLCHNQDNR
jgi:hypothetical protein